MWFSLRWIWISELVSCQFRSIYKVKYISVELKSSRNKRTNGEPIKQKSLLLFQVKVPSNTMRNSRLAKSVSMFVCRSLQQPRMSLQRPPQPQQHQYLQFRSIQTLSSGGRVNQLCQNHDEFTQHAEAKEHEKARERKVIFETKYYFQFSRGKHIRSSRSKHF